MQLTVIGSADAFNSGGRFHACYWLDGFGDKPLVLDFGATSLTAVRRAGKRPIDIGALLITHLHGDHIGGLPYLFIDGMFKDPRTETLDIIGPVLLQERVELLFKCVYPRVSQLERPFSVNWTELEPGASAEIYGVTVEAFFAEHMDPPDKPLCLRLTNRDGRVIAFSGDTEMCPGLFAAARGAELLVAECTGKRHYVGRHCVWEDWQRELPNIGAERVILSHLGADVRSDAAQLVANAPPGTHVEFADDGMVIEL